MKNRVIALLSVVALTLLMSSCFYGGYGYDAYRRPPHYAYAPRPYVRVVPPPVVIRPRVYVQPRHYSDRRYYKNPRNNGRYGNNGRRRW